MKINRHKFPIGTRAAAGASTLHPLAMELQRRRAEFQARAIPCKGVASAVQDVIPKPMPVAPIDSIVALPEVAEGKLKALALLAPKLLQQLPNVPTAVESRIEGLKVFPRVDLTAPRATQSDAIARLCTTVRGVVASPEITKRFTDLGIHLE